MDPDLILIFTFITIVTTILGFTINGIVSKVLAHKRWEREREGQISSGSPAVSQVSERTEMIEDRLRVLERLATDRGQLLSDEIEALRDSSAKGRQLEKDAQ